jgi:hypothetical protein
MIEIENIDSENVLLEEVNKMLLVGEKISINEIDRVYWASSSQVFDAIARDKIKVILSGNSVLNHVDQFSILSRENIPVKDSDGASIVRNKTTRSGWHYEPRSIDFTAGVAGSLYNRKHDGNTIDTGTDYGDAGLFFFDSSGVAITQGGETLEQWQTRLDAQCVRTQIDWQPTYEMDIIGATVGILNPPEGTDRGYVWIIIAPDIPSEYGGSVPFMAGGWNCRHFKGSPETFLDGRGVYPMAYDPIYNTNKIRVIVKHELNSRMEMQFIAEHFKA